MHLSLRTGAAAVVGLLLAAATNSWATTPADECEADKLKTAGKYTFCRMNAESKAIKKGEAPDYSKCDAKYGTKWGKVEAKAGGLCPVNGDLGDIQAQAADCADGLVSRIGGEVPDGCVAAELCGNGVIDAGEGCDLGTLNGATCVTQGFAGGTLSCSNGCAIDVSNCFVARFDDNADGTITDHLTGLMWEKKVQLNYAANYANLHDADNSAAWAGTCSVASTKHCQPTAAAAALCAANVVGSADGCAMCAVGEGGCNEAQTLWSIIAAMNAVSFAGYTDWRAPTLQELQTIVDYADPTPPMVDVVFHGASCGAACAAVANPACSCTREDSYWSASSYPAFTIGVYGVAPYDGSVGYLIKVNHSFLRAVRSGL